MNGGSSVRYPMAHIHVYDGLALLFALAVAVTVGFFAAQRRRVPRPSRPEIDFFDQIRDAALVTEDGVVVHCNAAALELFGYPRAQFIGLPVTRLLVDPADEKGLVKALRAAPIADYALRLKNAAGNVLECAVTATALLDWRGNVIGYRGLARDVTQQNRILAELVRAEHDYRGLFENAHDAILILDRFDETIIDVNTRACLMYDLSREEMIGRSMVERSVDPQRGKMLLQRTRKGSGRYESFESRQLRGDGTVIDVEINSADVIYRGQRVILSINRDVSARRRAETAVRESEARLRLLLESVTDYAIVTLDPAGRLASWNEGAQRIFGFRQEEVLGRDTAIFTPPEEGPTAALILEEAATSGRAEREMVRLRKDGSRFHASVTVTRMVDETQSLRGFVSVTRDITDRVQVERSRQELVVALRHVAAEWTETFDAVQVPIVMLDDCGEIRRLNQAAAALVGSSYRNVLGKPAATFDEPWPTIARAGAETLASGQARTDRVTVGDRVWQVSSCISGPHFENRRAIVVAHDLTLVTRLETSLRHNEVAAAMGSMVAAVAHEVRNPLFAITATLDAWGARYGEGEGMARYAGTLRDQVERLNRLMADLLEYGNPNPLSVRACSLDRPIRAAVRDCAVTSQQLSVTVEVEIAAELPPAVVDPPRIEQVLQNVIDNAVRHSPPGGTVRVAATCEGEVFVCRVIDEGPGIRAEDMERLFDPFVTRRRGGTGLGLAIAQRIVRAHGGTIALANREDGKGAIATIRLPLGTEEASERSAAVC